MASSATLFAGSVSSLYAKVRPTVSQSIIDRVMKYLGEKASPPYNLMVDIGCGTGLNTPFLAPHFKSFLGFDISPTQIDEARKANTAQNVTYEVNNSKRIPCESNTVNLITVIQTAHWLDHTPFFKECHRILLPKNGVLAILGYTAPHLSFPSFPRSRAVMNEIMQQFNNTLIKSGSWHKDRFILDRQYRDIKLPYEDQMEIRNDPELYLYKDMAVRTFMDYLSTWSGYREFKERYPRYPLLEDTQYRILCALPEGSSEDTVVTAIFPWFLMLCRKPA